jgi:hypothetical protein
MHAAGLRRMGFAAVLATGALMLGSALYGMTGVDDTLELAAAAPPEHPTYVIDAPPAHPVYVIDAPAARERHLVRDCEERREHHPRL